MEVSERMKPVLAEIEADKARLAELNALEKDLFGTEPTKPPADNTLKWDLMKADNHFVRSLKEIACLYAHMVKKEVETAEKNIKQARKVFHGR